MVYEPWELMVEMRSEERHVEGDTKQLTVGDRAGQGVVLSARSYNTPSRIGEVKNHRSSPQG